MHISKLPASVTVIYVKVLKVKNVWERTHTCCCYVHNFKLWAGLSRLLSLVTDVVRFKGAVWVQIQQIVRFGSVSGLLFGTKP